MTDKKTIRMYSTLHTVLQLAYDRASKGKGKERHANNQPFDQQVMARANRATNGGFSYGQIMKKIEEIPNLKSDSERVNEMLDIIVYAAGYVLVKLEKKDEDVDSDLGVVGNSGTAKVER